MLIGSEDHLQSYNFITENENVNCQKHDRNTRIKCISFLKRKITWKDVVSNRSPTPITILKKHFDPSPVFKCAFILDLALEVPALASTTFLGFMNK